MSRKSILLTALVLLYALIFLQQFLSDPLGQSPVLDARENLAWAERIASHELPEEPFYRALLYPWVLSWLPRAQVLAPALGVLCHLLNALLCGIIAMQLWRNRGAAWLSGFVYGVYPVSLFFAVQILDITLALTFFLLALYSLLRIAESSSWRFPVLAGLMAGLAVLARPNFLPAVLFFPLLGFSLFYVREKKVLRGVSVVLLVVVPMLILFLAQGIFNQRLSREFRLLPWQGDYNLYAANRDGANGRFYKQRVAFDAVPAGMNTTRMESEYLYREAVGPDAPMEVDAMGRYWRSQLQESISRDPLRWLGLMGRKIVYLFNDWEQYNNLTYAYHKERFLLLKWNPLGWGILLLGAAAGAILGWKRLSKAEAAGLGLCALAYAAGVLLFFVSARFRLPLAPLLCVFCGGLAGLSWDFARRHRSRCLATAGILVAVAVVSYGNWFDARDHETFIQDEILLANAALHIGNDTAALEFASKAAARDGSRQDALRLQVSALFNLWLAAEGQSAEKLWNALGQRLADLRDGDAATRIIEGVFYWREGDRAAATDAWEAAVERHGVQAGSSAAALEWVKASPGDSLSSEAGQIGDLLERESGGP